MSRLLKGPSLLLVLLGGPVIGDRGRSTSPHVLKALEAQVYRMRARLPLERLQKEQSWVTENPPALGGL